MLLEALALAALVLAGCQSGEPVHEQPSMDRSPGVAATERIAFSSDRSGQWRIWVMNADGSGMARLTTGTAADDDVDPAFSPDAAEMLFTSTRGGAVGVWRMRSDGTELSRICDGDQAEWRPDGAQIAFRRGGRIFTLDLADGRQKALTPEGWLSCSGPAWSPDVEAIAFARLQEGKNALFVVPAQGGDPLKLYDKEGACEPHWSPDSSRIAYETETHICTIRLDGTDNRLLTYFGGVQRYPRWSPDGQRIVFCQGVSERGPWELYVIPSQGGAPQRLTEGGSDIQPDWK